MSNENTNPTEEEIDLMLRQRFLKEYPLYLQSENIYSKVVHNHPPMPIEQAIAETEALPHFQFYWQVRNEPEKKMEWLQAQRDRVALWFANEQLRKETAELNRLAMADKLSRIDWKLLSWKTLSEILRMADKELLPQDKPK